MISLLIAVLALTTSARAYTTCVYVTLPYSKLAAPDELVFLSVDLV